MSPLADSPVKPSSKTKTCRPSITYKTELDTVLNDVDCIEIGTTNVCNRKCVSCPVGRSEIADKLSASGISDANFDKILSHLSVFKDRAFSLSLHEYNEPLKDTEILQKYAKVRVKFPHADLTLFTNGDMINHRKAGFYSIRQLLEAGIRHLRISIYDSNPIKSKIFQRIGIDIGEFKEYQNTIKNRIEFSYHTHYQGQDVLVRVLFLSTQKLSNRGGIIATDNMVKRQGICSLPKRTLSIDYKGNLKMCCNVHHMEAGADTWIHGSLLALSIEEILMGETYSKMRDDTSKGDYSTLEKCQVCDFYQKSSDRLIGRMIEGPRVGEYYP